MALPPISREGDDDEEDDQDEKRDGGFPWLWAVLGFVALVVIFGR